MASDWGSAFAGQEVQYTLVLRNTRAPAADGVNDLNNVTISSRMPSNLEVQGATADRSGSDPTVTGNDILYQIASLKPGEGVEIAIRSRIRANVARGTLIVAQSQVQYTGLTQPIFSNIVTVQVVDQAPQATVAPTATPTAPPPTATATATSAPASPIASPQTVQLTPTVGRGTPTSTATAQPPAGGVQPDTEAPLPATNAGVPLAGLILLGLTLLTRTVRLHRSRERI